MNNTNLVRQQDEVNLSLLCPPGLGVYHDSQVEEQGGRVAVVYQNNIMLTEKPVQQQSGLECRNLVLGDSDSTHLVLFCGANLCLFLLRMWTGLLEE